MLWERVKPIGFLWPNDALHGFGHLLHCVQIFGVFIVDVYIAVCMHCLTNQIQLKVQIATNWNKKLTKCGMSNLKIFKKQNDMKIHSQQKKHTTTKW